ncbi:hypothetical protein MtrunA17_Chr1g0173401 [Medicago truncatula]|uniref:Transmembrane protein n=1 Tax=Medicago truncatula TaxID=3880 RepID=A0A396JWM2_MEDTR|nr:hypothetical protein MtrunA17_Chr1g0173401 [Medicago truncatula]
MNLGIESSSLLHPLQSYHRHIAASTLVCFEVILSSRWWLKCLGL